MPNLLPPRPHYAREHARYPWLMLFCFAALFAVRLLAMLLPTLFSSALVSLVLQIALLLLPALLYIRMKGKGYGKAIRVRPPAATYIPLLFFAFLLLFSGSFLLSALFGGTHTIGNSSASFETSAPNSALQALIAVPVLALLPALCEELLFRGILCTELDRRGGLRAVLVGSLLFALIHFDLANLPVYFYAGVLLTLTLYVTDSLIATMIIHALYNVASLFGQRYLNAFYSFTGNLELFLFLLILVFLVALLLFSMLCARHYRARAEQKIRPPRRDIPGDVQLYTMFDALSEVPILLCFVIAIVGFILL
jgi:membrane protease YdiL (CAAX protease family)